MEKGHADVVAYLSEAGTLLCPSVNIEVYGQAPIRNMQIEIVKHIFNHIDPKIASNSILEDGFTLLMACIAQNNAKMFDFFFKKGANSNSNQSLDYPLYCATEICDKNVV